MTAVGRHESSLLFRQSLDGFPSSAPHQLVRRRNQLSPLRVHRGDLRAT